VTVRKNKTLNTSMENEEDSDDEPAPELLIVGQKDPPCPVLIISGYLGSGKTTLIQHILRSNQHGKRIAVIENEYGEGLQIESMIARDGAQSLTDLIELPNGCICCTVKSSLVSSIESLLQKRRDLDYILIECSGMADPGPIASLFWLDDALESRLQLHGIVTLVDSKNIEKQLSATHEAARQVAYADRLIVNKTDLVSKTNLGRVEKELRSINQTALIQFTEHACLPDLGWILDTSLTLKEASPDAAFCRPCIENRIEASHVHSNNIRTVSFVEPGAVDLTRLGRWLASILWPDQDAPTGSFQEIYRIKGTIAAVNESKRHIVQAVYDLWEVYPTKEDWLTDEERVSKLIIIGRNLDETALSEGFLSTMR